MSHVNLYNVKNVEINFALGFMRKFMYRMLVLVGISSNPKSLRNIDTNGCVALYLPLPFFPT